MPKVITIPEKKVTVYEFKELSPEVQQKVIEKHWDINLFHDWWDNTYADAKRIGLEITGFDIDRGNYCKGEFTLSANEVAQNILKEHGDKCETFKTAEQFLHNLDLNKDNEDMCKDLEDEFLNDICEDYKIILRGEYEYLGSEKAIIETIELNEYQFLEDGEIF